MARFATNTVKAVIVFILLGISGAMLFFPVVAGAEEVKGMFLMLTGIAVRDYFGGIQSDKRVGELKEAYDPAPQKSFVNDRDDGG